MFQFCFRTFKSNIHTMSEEWYNVTFSEHIFGLMMNWMNSFCDHKCVLVPDQVTYFICEACGVTPLYPFMFTHRSSWNTENISSRDQKPSHNSPSAPGWTQSRLIIHQESWERAVNHLHHRHMTAVTLSFRDDDDDEGYRVWRCRLMIRRESIISPAWAAAG